MSLTADRLVLAKCETLPIPGFDCGNADLNEWFGAGVKRAEGMLLTQTLRLVVRDAPAEQPALALVSLCNDAVRLADLRANDLDMPDGTHFDTWPAMKIAALAVRRDIQRQGIGSIVVQLVKELGRESVAGCRFLTVEADVRSGVHLFYEASEFEFFKDDHGKLTRSMWFDLSRLPSHATS